MVITINSRGQTSSRIVMDPQYITYYIKYLIMDGINNFGINMALTFGKIGHGMALTLF